jgi:predicted protein tyrosine phosphatase
MPAGTQMKETTSEKSPLRVDFLPPEAVGLPGRVGITIAPGKRGPGIGTLWRRDLDTDLVRLRDHFDMGLLVSLCEEPELSFLGIGNLYTRAMELGLAVEPFPIPDGGVPASVERAASVVSNVLDALGEGQTVVIHCRGGLGRSGLIAGCVLVARGTPAGEAMAIVRKARPGAIENRGQEAFIETFAAKVGVGVASR